MVTLNGSIAKGARQRRDVRGERRPAAGLPAVHAHVPAGAPPPARRLTRTAALWHSDRDGYREEPDDSGRRGRGVDRVVRLALPQERGLHRADRRDRRRGARAGDVEGAGADRARPQPAGHRRHRGLPPHPQDRRRPDPDAHGARRGRRQDHRPRGRRRRLPDEAVQPARARRAREVGAAPLDDRTARSSRRP